MEKFCLLKKNIFFASVFCVFLQFNAFSRGKNELIKSGSFVYDALTAIATEEGRLDFSDRTMISAGDALFFLEECDYSSLSDGGKLQYDRVKEYCAQEGKSLGKDFLHLEFEAETNFEAYYKSNDDFDWEYSRYDKKPLLYVPVKIDCGDYFTMMCEAQFAKNKNSAEKNDCYTNIPLSADQIDINFPDTGYFSTGKEFGDKFRVSFQLGKGSSSFSRSLTGDTAKSEYFTGASYGELSFSSRNFRYAMNITQFNVDKFMYTHEADLRFFRKFEFSVMESILVNNSLELRYMNPWTVYHGFAAWRDYGHNESNTCDYFALKLTWTPVRKIRLYGEFCMTQLQTPYETSHFEDDVTPNGTAFQGGIESFIPLRGGYFHVWLEGTYTDPYMYIKESPDWTVARNYRENLGDTKKTFWEWLGTPFGPDTLAGKISAGYEKPGKWSVGASYLLKICGENSGTKIFKNFNYHEGDSFSVDNAEDTAAWIFPDSSSQGADEAKRRQKLSTPSGTAEYVNTISLRGTYCPTKNVSLLLQPSYTFAFNFDNDSGRTEKGFEIAFGANVKIF